MYTIMRNIFINNYRKTVRDQTFVDQTDNLFHLNFSQESGFDSTEGAYDLKEIHRVVNALPKDYRVPFAMYVSGFIKLTLYLYYITLTFIITSAVREESPAFLFRTYATKTGGSHNIRTQQLTILLCY